MGAIIFWLIVGAISIFFVVTTRQQRKNWQSWFWISVAGLIIFFETISLFQYGYLTRL
jgi:uncharacterized membrane protein HdeD (DUF308 family)